MLDVTSYADKLPATLNALLKSFAGGECLMVRKKKWPGKFEQGDKWKDLLI